VCLTDPQAPGDIVEPDALVQIVKLCYFSHLISVHCTNETKIETQQFPSQTAVNKQDAMSTCQNGWQAEVFVTQ
jgi:hypothetical protein